MVPNANVSDLELQLIKTELELLLINLLIPDKSSVDATSTTNHRNYSYEQLDIITQYMLNHINENLTLEDISRGCAISPSKLNRICNELVGESPVSYFTYLKISEAQRLIKETSLNFTQISEQLGFNSVQYFSRLFKQRVRITPSEYAKLALKENN
jgi:AraC-like DNA-binding protein